MLNHRQALYVANYPCSLTRGCIATSLPTDCYNSRGDRYMYACDVLVHRKSVATSGYSHCTPENIILLPSYCISVDTP